MKKSHQIKTQKKIFYNKIFIKDIKKIHTDKTLNH